ncbi:uncharacterized protein LOC131665413 [Phymastichus coffea]|uniref:uncharacterized protein LOC131665413 n=1 Tax=Phymastichus coffea TaxID=108790 RepID=UPI00273B7804|nr:uncharacterized protein LOC131665413 [Phymastichus coffea]
MKVKKTSPKMSGLVVAALRNLRAAHGSTAKEIMKYIMAEYNASEAVVQRQLKTALKRGVEYGILKKTTAGYSLNTDAEVIGPFDLAQMDACGKRKKRSCKPKRRGCVPKKRSCPKKRKRSSCPRRRKKKNPCGMCAARGRRGDCGAEPVNLPASREGSPNMAANDDEDEEIGDAMTPQQHINSETSKAPTRSRSNSRGRNDGGARSRSQSLVDSDELDDEL